jgi:DnaK suppressor protein
MSKGFRGPDEAQVVTDRATADTIHRILDEDAMQAEHARARIAEGGYGVCEDCSGKIAPERLEALPDATRCVKCQAEWDKANRRL